MLMETPFRGFISPSPDKGDDMQRQSVESSMMRTVGYDPQEHILEIEFQSGGIYQYYKVDEEVFKELMEAESLARYFHDHIKDLYMYGRVG